MYNRYKKEDYHKGVRIESTIYHESDLTFGIVVECPQLQTGLKSNYSNISIYDIEDWWTSGLDYETKRIDDYIKSFVPNQLEKLGFVQEPIKEDK